MLCVFSDKKSLHKPVRKGKQKGYGFKISHYYWSFSSEIMAMKGLKDYQDGSGQARPPRLSLTQLLEEGYRHRLLEFVDRGD